MRPTAGTVAEIRARLTGTTPEGETDHVGVFPSGWEPLDDVLGGGLRTHELTLLAGAPGVGKTIATLQWARNMALSGRTALYVCYEHSDYELLHRLWALELGSLSHPDNAPAVHKLRGKLRGVASGEGSYDALLAEEPLLRAADEMMQSYADRLHFIRGATGGEGLAELEQHVTRYGNGDNVLVVDYLQKVPTGAADRDQDEKTLRIAEGLKNLALDHRIAVVSTVAADRAGLGEGRLRMNHLRGSSALEYEADVVVTMNEKMRAVARNQLSYNPARAEEFQRWVVFTVEKNRNGAANIDLEFEKDFANYRFDPTGRFVSEQLVDGRIYTE